MDTFFAWLIERWESFYFVFLVRPYERAVHIRGGRLKRVCPPGWYFKRAFEYDEIHKINVVTTTTNLKIQVITPVDGSTWIVGVVVKWKVKEDFVARLIIDLEEHEDVFRDTIYGMVSRHCRKVDMKVANMDDIERGVMESVRRRVGKFGFDVEDFWITDVSKARTIRLVTGDN